MTNRTSEFFKRFKFISFSFRVQNLIRKPCIYHLFSLQVLIFKRALYKDIFQNNELILHMTSMGVASKSNMHGIEAITARG